MRPARIDAGCRLRDHHPSRLRATTHAPALPPSPSGPIGRRSDGFAVSAGGGIAGTGRSGPVPGALDDIHRNLVGPRSAAAGLQLHSPSGCVDFRQSSPKESKRRTKSVARQSRRDTHQQAVFLDDALSTPVPLRASHGGHFHLHADGPGRRMPHVRREYPHASAARRLPFDLRDRRAMGLSSSRCGGLGGRRAPSGTRRHPAREMR